MCSSPLAAFEEEKKTHEAKMKKMEKEMKQVFEQKVKEKEVRLQQSEEKVCLFYFFLFAKK